MAGPQPGCCGCRGSKKHPLGWVLLGSLSPSNVNRWIPRMVIWNILIAACSAGTPLGTGHSPPQTTFKLSPSFPLPHPVSFVTPTRRHHENNIPHALSWLDLELFP